MATKLKNLVITKVALVDEGSCSDAHIKLFKRKEGGNNPMTIEEILKSLSAEQQTVINDAIAKAKAELPEGALSKEDVTKLKETHTAELAKSKTSTESPEEQLLKSTNLDPVVKSQLESIIAKQKIQEDIIAKMKDESLTNECIAKAKETANIPQGDKLATVYKAVHGNKEAEEALATVLKSADALIKQSAAFTESGVGGGTGTVDSSETAWANIEKAAEEVVKSKNISLAKAIEVVVKEKPELYKAYNQALLAE